MMESNDLIGYEDASQITGICKPTLYAMVSQKRLPHFRLGGRLVRFSRAELIRWVEAKHVAEDKVMKDASDE